jgi:hypothetical protein
LERGCVLYNVGRFFSEATGVKITAESRQKKLQKNLNKKLHFGVMVYALRQSVSLCACVCICVCVCEGVCILERKEIALNLPTIQKKLKILLGLEFNYNID